MTPTNQRRGKLSRARGARFELKVRADLNSQGYIVDKWTNNVDFEKDKIVPAKRKYNPFFRALSIGNGFPDFIAFKRKGKSFDVIGVEVKMKGYLKPEEKERCRWYLKNKTFNKILIARVKKEGVRINVEYIDFEKKFGLQ